MSTRRTVLSPVPCAGKDFKTSTTSANSAPALLCVGLTASSMTPDHALERNLLLFDLDEPVETGAPENEGDFASEQPAGPSETDGDGVVRRRGTRAEPIGSSSHRDPVRENGSGDDGEAAQPEFDVVGHDDSGSDIDTDTWDGVIHSDGDDSEAVNTWSRTQPDAPTHVTLTLPTKGHAVFHAWA